MEVPPLCVMSVWAVGLHLAYLCHVGACEWYDDQTRCIMMYFNIRYDFTTVHPLLLEWVHTFETGFLLALAAFGCERRDSVVAPCALVAVVGVVGCVRVVCSDRSSHLFGRRSA